MSANLSLASIPAMDEENLMKAFRLFFVTAAFCAMIGLACSFLGGAGPQTQERPTHIIPTSSRETQPAQVEPTQEEPIEEEPTPEEPVNEEPTEAEPGQEEPNQGEPTEEEPSDEDQEPGTDLPTNEPADPAQYFTETFDGSLGSYSYFNMGRGDDGKMSLETDSGFLVFDLKDTNLWIYITYNPFTYKNVTLELTASGQGKNANTTSLICRHNEDHGWYEFSVSNSGLYWIYAFDSKGIVSKGYNKIADGRSNAVSQGDEANTYSASCIGNKLTLSINGVEVKSIRDEEYKFLEGKVGFGAASFDLTPVLVKADTFTIGEP